MILVDKREPIKIFKLLTRMGISFEKCMLKTGDFVKGNACVERKTADDFASSLVDGRLFKQSKRMRENYGKCAIVVSGKRKRQSERLTMNCLLGAMASITARLNIPIVTVGNDRQLLNFAIKFLNKATDGKKIEYYQFKKAAKSYNYKIGIIASIPGIGFDKAKKLFEKFRSVKKVADASIEDIQSIKGIGKRTASKIKSSLN